jgi:hypothetical protein
MGWLWMLIAALRAVSPAPQDQWATLLAELDRTRAEAFATTDADLLDGVYVRGSRAWAVDAATIAAYRQRRARVIGAELRIVSCRVLAASRTRVRLDVVDRLAPARVVWADGTTTALPRDEPTGRVVTLVRTAGGWRVAGVSPRP